MAARSGSDPSLDGASASGASDIAKLNAATSPAEIRRAVRHRKQTACPSALRVASVYSLATRKAYEVPCGKWTCQMCGWRKQRIASYLALAGMIDARNRGDRVRFMTFTETPRNRLDVPELSACWNRLRTRLVRQGLLREYCAVVEATQKGRPHLHCVTTGKFIWQAKLSQMAEDAGFGRVADIREVHFKPDPLPDDQNAAAYVCKELAAYVSKSKGDALGALVAVRRRPMRTSRGWYPGGMERARREILADFAAEQDEPLDGGPWWFVMGDPAGALTISGRTADGEPFKVRDLATTDDDGGKVEELTRSERQRSDAEATISADDEGRRAA